MNKKLGIIWFKLRSNSQNVLFFNEILHNSIMMFKIVARFFFSFFKDIYFSKYFERRRNDKVKLHYCGYYGYYVILREVWNNC